jgi:hypothetical protein
MSIKRLKDFPDGSGSLTSDDIFLFMDDPTTSGITKKISLSELSSSIGGGISNIVEDTTPQLGGNLDLNNNNIIGTGNIDINGSGDFTYLSVNNSSVSLSGHTHTSSNITDFNSSVSGLLPVKNIVDGTGTVISSNSGIFTVNVNDAPKIVTNVFNNTGSSIPKFRAVYINGGQGDQPTIALASYNGEGTSSKTYGVTAQQIDHMSTGNVVVFGALTQVNTQQFNPAAPNGDVNGSGLYLGPSGLLTITKPSAPYHAVYIGTIVRTHQNEGVVEIRVQNGFEIEELHNVKISGVSHNDVLVHNSGTSLWENNNKVVFSDTTGISGASGVNNLVQISQANYDALATKDPNTIYFIV